jgi:acyl dehydratase
MNFLAPVRPGDNITTTVTVTQKHPAKPIVTFSCACTNQHGQTVLTAEAVVKAPTKAPSPAP